MAAGVVADVTIQAQIIDLIMTLQEAYGTAIDALEFKAWNEASE